MVLEIREITIKVVIDTNKYTDQKTFVVRDLEEDLEEVKSYIEQHVERSG